MTSLPKTSDITIIGGGIMGLTVALALKRRFNDASIVLIEKENRPGQHASGRNSGVLHAGFYYAADSLKARFTRDGNKRLTDYCLTRKIPINRCGKLVLARTEEEQQLLEVLFQRADTNGVPVERVTEQQAREIEPRAIVRERALWSPTTSSVNPNDIIAALEEDAGEAGIQIISGVSYRKHSGNILRTNCGDISSGYVVNCAGLYADRIASDFGFARAYTILPFKGLYLKSSEPTGSLHTNVYPVPELKRPFLGVHLTLSANGQIKLGPTAIPALWREHYRGLGNFSWNEFLEIAGLEASLLVHNNFGFRDLAWEELRKYRRASLLQMASNLVTDLQPDHYKQWALPGIRAQLVNLKERRLEMDFKYEGDDKSFHLLNAVSPAFTCSMAFSEYLVDQMENECHLS